MPTLTRSLLLVAFAQLSASLSACKVNDASGLKSVPTSTVPNVGGSIGKGVGDFSGRSNRIDGLNVSWYYNWTPRPAGGVQAEFVPMIWGDRDVNDGTFAALKAAHYSTILAFNEPDQSSGDQSGMSVDHAAAIWTNKLVPLGKRLGSPSATNYEDGAWLDQFMAKVDKNTVGFIAVHHYASNAADPASAVAEYQALLTKIHNKYNKPIWLTEFGGPAYSGTPSEAQETAFLTQVVAMLSSLGYVERYAWYSTQAGKDGGTYGPCLLFSDSDAITSLGTTYRGFGGGTLVAPTSPGVPAGMVASGTGLGDVLRFGSGTVATSGVPITAAPISPTPFTSPTQPPTGSAANPWTNITAGIINIISTTAGAAGSASTLAAGTH